MDSQENEESDDSAEPLPERKYVDGMKWN